LAEAARRVNGSEGTGPVTIHLSDGIYSISGTAMLKPGRRKFTQDARLAIRAWVLPVDPDWHTGRMPALIHTMPLPKTWNGRPDRLGGAAWRTWKSRSAHFWETTSRILFMWQSSRTAMA
jgi:hypothetical protein